MVPVVGVLLIVLFADKETLAARLLSTKLFVGIGLISYSAYLWHQSLFTCAKIRSVYAPSEPLMLGLVVISFVFAVLSWRLVEQPFRKKTIKRKYIFGFGFSSLAISLSVGALLLAVDTNTWFQIDRPNFKYDSSEISRWNSSACKNLLRLRVMQAV